MHGNEGDRNKQAALGNTVYIMKRTKRLFILCPVCILVEIACFVLLCDAKMGVGTRFELMASHDCGALSPVVVSVSRFHVLISRRVLLSKSAAHGRRRSSRACGGLPTSERVTNP